MESCIVEHSPYQQDGTHRDVQVPCWREVHPSGYTSYFLDESFWVERTFLGTRRIRWFVTNDGKLANFSSQAFFCPQCGQIWGRIILVPDSWFTRNRYCLKHGGGSLLMIYEDDNFETYPKDFILYELMLATKELV